MRRQTTAAAALLIAGLALAGCSASSGARDASMPELSGPELSGPELSGPELSAPDSGGADSGTDRDLGATGGAAADGAASDVEADAVVVNGTIRVAVEDPAAAAGRIATIADAAGGRVDARTETAASDHDRGRAALTIRIPAERVTETVEALRELGRVDGVSLDSVEVGGRVRDLASRISGLESSITRLTALIERAASTDDLIGLETAISDRQTQLELLRAEQRNLADQVSLATLHVEVASTSTPPPPTSGPDDLGSALAAGWESFVAFWAAVVVALGVALPWLVLLGLVVLGIVVLVRRRRSAPAAGPPAAASPAPAETAETAEPTTRS